MSLILGRNHRALRGSALLLVAGVVATTVLNIDDIKRYLKIKSM